MFDVGRVLFEWDLRHLFGKLIADRDELEWFVTHVVTPEWHFQVDEGRDVAAIVAERSALYPQYAALIAAYATRFVETIPGPVAGSIELVNALDAAGLPLFALTNFGEEFWARFRPQHRVFDRFREIVVSGVEKMAKPDPAIYALAERRYGVGGLDVLFIDDNADNIVSAAAFGWQVHLFTDAPTLAADLRDRGLIG